MNRPGLLVLLLLVTLGSSYASDEWLLFGDDDTWENNQRINIPQKFLEDEEYDDHVIKKREVGNDEALEGSGDDSPITEEPPKSAQQNSTPTQSEPVVAANTTSPSAVTHNVEVTDTSTNAETTTTSASTVKPSTQNQTTVAVKSTTVVEKFLVHEIHVQETPKENGGDPFETDKKQDTNEKENTPVPQPPVYKEEIDSKQSGVAVLATNDNTTTLEGSERTLSRMKPNETLKSAAVDEPVPGESRPESASNDTKIILFLVAGVAAVGAAAFTYNYVRKKRQNETSTVDRQNGACAKSNDPEEGRELKPLMRNGEGETRPPTAAVEYEDENESGK